MTKKIGVIVCVLTMIAGTSVAKPKTVKTDIRSWQLSAPTYQADTVQMDTSFINLPMREHVYDNSISNVWNGTLVSPIQSRLFFARKKTIDDLFGTAYQPYVITPHDLRFYNTNVPYSMLAYKKGFTTYHEENEINFVFAGNVNKRLNLGLRANYLSAAGHYLNQENKLFNGAVFGSYNGDHYSLHAAFAFAKISNFENGGIKDLNDLTGTLEPEDIPVRLHGMSGYRYLTGFINHYYSLTVEREKHDSVEIVNNFGEKEKVDSVRIEYVPVTTFAHTFDINNSNRRYIETDAWQNYYPDKVYRNWKETRDSSDVLTLTNTLAVTFEEEFNTLLKFGAVVYASNECQRFMYPKGVAFTDLPVLNNDFDTILANTTWMQPMDSYRYRWTNNTFIGGSIYKKRGSVLHYGVNGDVCLIGYKLGEFQVNGHVDAFIRLGKDTMTIKAAAGFRNETPSVYWQSYTSNHFCWTNDFSKPMRLDVSGIMSYPTKWVKPSVKVNFANLTKPLWFDSDGLPKQFDGNVQVIAADVHCDLTTPWVNLENNVVWQHATSSVIPLPAVTLYHNLYYHGTWFKALDAQIGLDLRYHTAYHAPLLNPATGQFCVQNDVEVGNYPIMNVYLNFHVRSIHLNFFAHYTHFNHLFMRENTDCQIMPFYPYNPDVFRAGLAWQFYR